MCLYTVATFTSTSTDHCTLYGALLSFYLGFWACYPCPTWKASTSSTSDETGLRRILFEQSTALQTQGRLKLSPHLAGLIGTDSWPVLLLGLQVHKVCFLWVSKQAWIRSSAKHEVPRVRYFPLWKIAFKCHFFFVNSVGQWNTSRAPWSTISYLWETATE